MRKLFQTGPDTRINVMLACLAGILLGLAYPPFPLGVFAYIGFVPLFFLLNRLETTSRQFTYLYLSFFVMSVIALYWVGGFTHLKDPYLMMAGGLLLFWQPVYFSFAMLVFVFVRNRLGVHRGMLAFPFLWVTFEWLYAYSELSFPWLTLGNTQSYFLDTIQFIEYTGVYGLSFWILVLNVIAYYIVTGIRTGGVTRSSTLLAAVFAAVLLLPNLYPFFRDVRQAPEPGSASVTIGVIQPNIDPWDKWEGAATFSGRWRQTLHYLDLVGKLRTDSVDIAILPESAILFDLPTVGEYAREVRTILDSLHMGLVSGYMGMHIYTAGTDHAKVALSGLEHGRALAIREHLLPSGAGDAV